MGAESNLIKLGLALPLAPSPLGAYLPVKSSGSLLFVSGVLPMKDGRLVYKGKLGFGVSLEEGIEASKICCLNALSILKAEIGSLDKVKEIIKLSGFVASDKDFYDQPKVVNGASELLVEIFGEKGKHARAALGCPSLPADSPVEIEMIVEVDV